MTQSDKNEDLLSKIREDFSYVKSYWAKNYEAAAKDMDCMAGIPPSDFSEDRKGRPCIWPDETSQYVNQANNNLRQNKRSIKLSPKSEDATDKDAEHRQAYIRGIEDASKAQSIYTTAYESAVQCGFGYWRLTIIPTGQGKYEPRLRRIPNWATVFPDPDAKEADFSDSSLYFVTDSMRESTFEKRYSKATKRSFTGADREAAPDWLSGGNIVVAEYWTREEKEAQDGEKVYTVTQRITNGLEILDTTDWIGSWIPIIGVFGKEMYVKEGTQSKRLFMSMIRRGLPAQHMMAYIASQEAEEFALAPRAAFVGYKGTFVNPEKTWKVANKVPLAFLEVDIPSNWPPGVPPPPLPSRPQFTPNPQAYEMAYERWRRSHQAAVAGSPLPTDAQKVNDKSGAALERIENSGMLGNFHFMDNYSRALHNTGEQANELITKLAETKSLPERVLGKDQKGDDLLLKVAPPESSEELPESQEMFMAHRGKYTVTISEGPNFASEREEKANFADLMWQTAPKLGLPPQVTTQVLSIATKMKNLGALGDELADLLAPPDPNNLPPQARAMVTQATAKVQELQGAVQQLMEEKQGKVVEGGFKVWAEQIRAETAKAVAEINTKAQSLSERIAAIEELEQQVHGQAHEAGMQAVDHAHEHSTLDKQAEIARAQADQQAMHQSAQSAQDHVQNVEAQPNQGAE